MNKAFLALPAALAMLTATHSSTAADKPDPQFIQAFLTDTCPTDVGGGDHALALVGSLIGFGIDKVLDAFGKSLSEAAEKDEKGVAKSARVPAYLYNVTQQKGSKKFSPNLMTCIVIAKAPSGPADWCKTAPLHDQDVCNSKAPLLETILKPLAGADAPTGSGNTTFYAEIKLAPSTDQRGFIPVLNALYYPTSVNPEESKFKNNKTARDLSITVSASSPSGEPALSAVNLHLTEILPDSALHLRSKADKSLRKAFTPLWVGVVKPPAYKKPPGMPEGAIDDATYDHRAFPVNVSVELREIGEPRAYLKVLAALFGKYKGQIAEELKSHLPEASASAQQQEALAELEASGKYQEALGAAFKAIAALDTACEKPTNKVPNQGRTTVLQNFYASAAAVGAVRKLELVGGIDKPAMFPAALERPVTTSDTALAICQALQ